MAKCETCGNDYDKPLVITVEGVSHTFDCFECAIQALAPACAHCGCAIIGHGVERDGLFYCCYHCARHKLDPAVSEQEGGGRETERSARSP